MREFNYEKGFTHGSVFHADDVFATAFIKMICPEIEIERGNEVPEGYNGIIFDIGNGEFDHHQIGNEKRESGVPYAAFGKLWRAFAPERFSDYVVDKIDSTFISKLDAADNGMEKSQLAEAIEAFNPVWNSKQSEEEAFFETVEFASAVLRKVIETAEAEELALSVVKDALEKTEGDILVLPFYCPWMEPVSREKSVKFVIYPSARGGYCIHTVPENEPCGKNRVDFPKRWLGNPDSSMGMTFCHMGNFLASTRDLDQAVNVAQVAIVEADPASGIQT